MESCINIHLQRGWDARQSFTGPIVKEKTTNALTSTLVYAMDQQILTDDHERYNYVIEMLRL
jgi:hypothetical protein